MQPKKYILKTDFFRFKKDTKNTWKVIMNLFQKSKQIKNYLFFTDNDVKITDKKDIANKCNNYFTNIGQSISQGIKYKGSKNTVIM